uniref:Uncharacterized protein n=1 Tax=Arundo donax TaxID=35708 RepID=A0A0A9BDP7_ARUDO
MEHQSKINEFLFVEG